MEFLNLCLPVILYLLGIILLIILIILGIRFINILDKVDRIVDDVEDKVNSFSGAITTLSKVADGIVNIGDSVVAGIASTVSKIFKKKMKEEEMDYE